MSRFFWSVPTSLLLIALLGGACGPAPTPREPGNAPLTSHPSPAADIPSGAVEVTLLANEGFLLRSVDQAVLIDAFLATPYAGYDALTEDLLAKLSTAEAPFHDIDLALVSHEHADHVQARPARAFLSASPDTLLPTSPQVLAVIEGGDAYRIPTRAEVLPEVGATARLSHAGIDLEFLRLSHGDKGPNAIQNLGHVITIGGLRVLHLGDGQAIPESFRPYKLGAEPFDVALIPWWYFYENDGQRLVRDELDARVMIACHVASHEREEIASDLADSHPRVIVPSAPLQSWTVEPPAR